MKPHGLSQNALARALNVPPRRVNEIVMEKRSITADTALRLARYFRTTAELWAGLQADYDLRLVRYEREREIERDVEPLAMQPAMASKESAASGRLMNLILGKNALFSGDRHCN